MSSRDKPLYYVAKTILENPSIIQAIIEGFIQDWTGVFDIVIDNNIESLMFNRRGTATKFCEVVRKSETGNTLCNTCDSLHIRNSIETLKPFGSLCHAGLYVLSVPILVSGECVATILWGQCRHKGEEEDSSMLTYLTEQKLGLTSSELSILREDIPLLSNDEIGEVKRRLEQVAEFIGQQCDKVIELERTKIEVNTRREEALALQQVVASLMEIGPIESFWGRFDKVLTKICDIIGAIAGAVFFVDDTNRFRVVSVANLPGDIFKGKSYVGSEEIFRSVLQKRESKVIDFEYHLSESFCKDVAPLFLISFPDRVGLVPLVLSAIEEAIICFFVNADDDIRNSLIIDDELPIIMPLIASQIITAHENSRLFSEKDALANEMKKRTIEKDSFFEIVAHQLIAPLNSLQANADRLLKNYEYWTSDENLTKIKTIRSLSRSAARLARNFEWNVRSGTTSINVSLSRLKWTRLIPFLIACAIDVQGMAVQTGIRVHVDENIDPLLEVHIDKTSFSQVIVNVMDNAVKYSKENTLVLVSVETLKPDVAIRITNYGISISKEEAEKVFERDYRGETAKENVIVGSGLGLFVARDIVHLHGGSIRVQSSTYYQHLNAYEVVFEVRLPAYRIGIS
jgi:signal transduction histidine kinase/ligand-binding sensor protein